MGHGPRGLLGRTAIAGIIFRTITRAAAPIAGARTVSWGSRSRMPPLLRARVVERRDPILKERFFGLTNPEGNHGEDVKESYFYLDAMPTHSYSGRSTNIRSGLIPTRELVEDESPAHAGSSREFEITDTDVFDENRYFDVFIEYAKAAPDDILIQITATNRGPEAGDAASSADALVSQYLVLGAR